jgi:hypothetical protein
MCTAAASGSSSPNAFLKARIESASSPLRSSLPGGKISVTYLDNFPIITDLYHFSHQGKKGNSFEILGNMKTKSLHTYLS